MENIDPEITDSSNEKKSCGIIAFFRRQNWENFLMEFLSVFLGIVLTFAGDAWIKRRQEANDIRESLTLVKEELKENMLLMKDVQEHMDLENSAAKYLMQYYDRFEECERDSMIKYCNVPLDLYPSKVSDEALELLKNSALFQKIQDKELSLNIIRAYRNLNVLCENYVYFNDKKQKLLDLAMQEQAKALFARTNFSAAEMWTALTSTDDGKQFLHEISISVTYGFGYEDVESVVNEVIEQIEENL